MAETKVRKNQSVLHRLRSRKSGKEGGVEEESEVGEEGMAMAIQSIQKRQIGLQ